MASTYSAIWLAGAGAPKLLGHPFSGLWPWWLSRGRGAMLRSGSAGRPGLPSKFLHPKTGRNMPLAAPKRKSGQGYGGLHFSHSPDVTLERT